MLKRVEANLDTLFSQLIARSSNLFSELLNFRKVCRERLCVASVLYFSIAKIYLSLNVVLADATFPTEKFSLSLRDKKGMRLSLGHGIPSLVP